MFVERTTKLKEYGVQAKKLTQVLNNWYPYYELFCGNGKYIEYYRSNTPIEGHHRFNDTSTFGQPINYGIVAPCRSKEQRGTMEKVG